MGCQRSVSALACLYRLRNTFPDTLPRRLPELSGAAIREYLSKSTWVSVSQVAQVLLSGTEILVIGKLLGPNVVVVYACTTKLISVLNNQPVTLMQVALPGLSEMKTAQPPDRILHVCTALGQAMLLLSGAVVCVVVAVNGGFVNWWVGPRFYGGLQLTVLAAVSMLLRHFNLVLVYTLFSLGRQRRIAITEVIDGLVSTTSSLVLVSAFGIVGAPMGSIIGTVLVSLTFNSWALCKELVVQLVHWCGHSYHGRFDLRSSLRWPSQWQECGYRPPSAFPDSWGIGLIYLAVNYATLAYEPLGIYLMPRLRLVFSRLREARV